MGETRVFVCLLPVSVGSYVIETSFVLNVC